MLIRHAAHDDLGRVLSGRTSLSINAVGRTQAARLAERLGGRAPRTIQSSPQLRTRQTAQRLAEHFAMEVTMTDALDEIDFGNWTGASFEALAGEPLWHAWNSRRSTCAPPQGEAMTAAVARAVRHCETLRDGTDADVFCVSHGDIIRGTIAHYLGLDLDRMLGFEVAPASVSRLRLTPSETCVVNVNEVVA